MESSSSQTCCIMPVWSSTGSRFRRDSTPKLVGPVSAGRPHVLVVQDGQSSQPVSGEVQKTAQFGCHTAALLMDKLDRHRFGFERLQHRLQRPGPQIGRDLVGQGTRHSPIRPLQVQGRADVRDDQTGLQPDDIAPVLPEPPIGGGRDAADRDDLVMGQVCRCLSGCDKGAAPRMPRPASC